MDNQQEQRINEAAEKFANAVTESYRTVSERAVSTQELNAELTQNFFNGVIRNLRTQAESNREATRQLADQQQRQQEATQALTQESVSAYMDFVNSLFSYSQGNVEQVQRQASEAQRPASEGTAAAAPETSSGSASEVQASGESVATPETGSSSAAVEAQTSGEAEVASDTSSESASEDSPDAEALLENYDSMNVGEVSEKLDDLSVEEIRQLRDYEVQNKNRSTLIERFDLRIEAGS